MAIQEKITLNDTQYTATWEKVNRTAKRGARDNAQSFQTIQKEARKTGGTMDWLSKRSEAFGMAMKRFVGTVAVSAVIALGIAYRNFSKEQVRFDQEMAKSLAIQGKVTLEQRKLMEDTARSVARELNISSDKVAESYFFLASAGLDVEQQIAALPAVARFAKAGMFDLATATDLATDAQSALGLTVEDNVKNKENLIRVTDVLTKANVLSNATIQQFSEALTNESGATIKSFNKDIEEGVAVLAAYADQGEKGQRAGSLLSRVIRLMTTAAINNKKEMRDLGIEVFDSTGNMRNMADIIEDLEVAFSGMSDEQRTAALESIGFQARMQGAILPLIGASDAIREYEKDLRDAAGTTEEVANNQMNNLTDRVTLLWSAFKNTFGDQFLSLLDKALSKVEEISDEFGILYDRWFGGSPTERLLSVLEDTGGDENLILRLRLINAKEEAENVRKELEEELSKAEVPIKIDEKGLLDQGLDLGEKIWDNIFGGQNLFSAFTDISSSIQNFQFESEVFDPDKIEDYKDIVNEAAGSIETISKAIAESNTMSEDSKEIYTELVQKYAEQITKVQTIITKYEALLDLEENIGDMNKEIASGLSAVSEDSGKAEEEVKKYTDTVAFAGQVTELFLKKSEPKNRNVIDIYLDHLSQKMTRFQEDLTSLNNELSTGIIDEEAFKAAEESLKDNLVDGLSVAYNSLRDLGLLTPDIERTFRAMFRTIKRESKEADKDFTKLIRNLDQVSDGVSAIANAADNIDGISDNFVNAVRSSADLISNLSNIAELIQAINAGQSVSALSFGIPAIGVVSSLIGIGSSLFGGGSSGLSREEMEELRASIKSQISAINRNTEALMGQTLIGGQFSNEEISRISAIFEDLKLLQNKEDDKSSFTASVESQIRRRLEDLADALPDQFGNIVDLFNDMLEGGSTAQEALRSILGNFGDQISNLIDNFGSFGSSLDAIIERFNFLTSLGFDQNAALNDVIDEFISRLKDLPSFGAFGGNEISKLLEELKKANSKEEREELARKIWEAFLNNPDLLGDEFTPDEFKRFLEFLVGQDTGDGSGSDNEFSRSVQIARTITEIQANEVITLLYNLLLVVKDIRSAIVLGEIPPPVASSVSGGVVNRAGNTFNFDVDLSISSGSRVGDDDIDYIASELSVKLKEELRNEGFYN